MFHRLRRPRESLHPFLDANLVRGLGAALAAALIGSFWQLASRHGVTTTLGPAELAVLRYGLPALALLPLLCKTGLLSRHVPRRALAGMVVCGGLPFGLLALAGARHAPAAHMGVFMSGAVPLFTALAMQGLWGERLSGPRWLGLALVAAGVFLLGGATLASGHDASWRGDLLFALAAMLWAAYGIAFRASGLTPWQGAALVNAWSALLLLPVLAIVGAPRLLTAPWTDVALQAFGQGIVAGLLGLVTYTAAVARLGAARASLSAALVPLLTALGAAWLLAEPLNGVTLASVLLVAGGVALASGAIWKRG